jgi:flavin-dependent dehydrogenase
MKIVIVGGGTAGWLAALMIKKIQGDSHQVTLVESSKIGIIGAGEGSTGYLTDIIQGNNWDYGCDEIDFIKSCNATVKLGIKHKDWKHKNHSYIAPIDSSATQGLLDYITLHAVANDLPFHLSSMNGYCIEHNKSTFFINEENKTLENFKSHAYHFDAFLVGQYFKKVCGKSVTSIDSEVVDILLHENGEIQSIYLSNGQTIEGDFFIDCSGFKRLFAEKMKVKWKSYNDNLPVNKAMPFLLKYDGNEKIEPVTTAWAQSSGWMWQIPTQNRYGCGYVYCDEFISDDEAKREIEQSLGKEIEPIRTFKFETGRQEVLWEKNCLFLGLCAAFAEPLEATSIHSTIVQLQIFIFEYLMDTKEETLNRSFIKIYNKRIGQMYDDFKDFLNIHYMTQRQDSEFWRFMNSGNPATETTKLILELHKNKSLRPSDLNSYYGMAGAPLYNWVLAGLGHLNKNLAQKELLFHNKTDHAKQIWDIHQYNFEMTTPNLIDNNKLIFERDKYLHGYTISKHINL